MTTGDRIRVRRKQLNLTQEELGTRIGVAKSTINKYEKNNVTGFKRSMIAELAKALEVTPGYLMGWEDLPKAEAQIVEIPESAHLTLEAFCAKPQEYLKPQKPTEEEAELIRIYRGLPVKARLALLSKAYELEDGTA